MKTLLRRIQPAMLAIAMTLDSTSHAADEGLSDAAVAAPRHFSSALYSGPMGSRGGGRSAVVVNPIYYDYAIGQLEPPHVGDISGTSFRGEQQHWRAIDIDESGVFSNEQLRGGYIYLTYEADEDETMILRPNGFSEVFVNGIPRGGDVYGKNWMILPVKLAKGLNEFWCRVSRGRDKSMILSFPPKPVYLTTEDATLPDLLTTEKDDKWAAMRIINATEDSLVGLTIQAESAGQNVSTELSGAVAPMTARQVPFKIRDAFDAAGEQVVHVKLLQKERVVDEIDLPIEVKDPSQQYRRTFLSDIDGSVQYYGVREGTAEEGRKPAMFLSVHGAGVKAIGQAGSYKSKDWGHVVAPTNRREFGFDWEDWGRLDAMEVLKEAEARYQTDPQRTYLTGHSMGGHGTWYLGLTYPSRWAAIAPMAGWRSFFSYTNNPSAENHDPMEAMLERAENPSRTLELIKNCTHQGVYIEHGDNDQNVPVREARFMRQQLGTFHPDFAYFEEPGGAHWYGVDHPNLFDYFKWHEVENVRDLGVLEFRTACPGVSAQSYYITLYQQEQPFDFSGVVAKQTIRSRRQRRNDEEINKRKFEITTENLAVFRVDLAHCKGFQEVTMEVDGQGIDDLPWPQEDEVWLKKVEGSWQPTDPPHDPQEKNPQRYGGFKDAFRHHMVFVYSTAGNDKENTWSYNKARFDAETFYYRGNGSIDIIPDSEFTRDAYQDRSVIVYGNAATNSAWDLLLADCPVQVRRGELEMGDRLVKADNLGVYMVRPRRDSAIASVGVISGSGIQGFQAVVPNQYFVAGTGYPDLMVVSPEMYARGSNGIVAAGYFGNDWSVQSGSFVWNPQQAESGPQ